MNLELCTDSVEGAEMAARYGFKRIELCAALSEGGLTPSFGLTKACAQAAEAVEVHVMIRTRGGGFTCSSSEFKVMAEDVEQAARAGAKGVVFGILEEDGHISQLNSNLCNIARGLGLQATFHRAFDQLAEPFQGVETLIDMNFNRVLTSGSKEKAIDGLELLRDLQSSYGQRIDIMAGSGVNAQNAPAFLSAGIENLHFTARRRSDDKVIQGMGIQMVTDEEKVREILAALKQ